MFGSEFYHSIMRKLIAVFGTMFNEIVISRLDDNGNRVDHFVVPIAYGPIQQWLAFIQSNPDLTQKQAITLPRLAFEITNVSYDPERKLAPLSRTSTPLATNDASVTTAYSPAPYNIDFTLYVMAKYREDAAKIVEQVLPWFKPEWTSSVDLLNNGTYYDIPTTLNTVSNEEVYEGSYQERQVIIWSLTFTMKAYFFGPTSEKKIIKFANVNIYSSLSNGSYSNTAISNVKVFPGLLANGSSADYTTDQTVQATATANTAGGAVNEITVTNRGWGYLDATVTISDPDVGSNTATATANVQNEYIQSIDVTFAGSGYTSEPTVTISAPDNVTVPYSQINADDDWDYIVVITENP